MFEQEAGNIEKDRSRMIILVSGVAVLLVLGAIILYQSIGSAPTAVEMAAGGTPEFDSYKDAIVIRNLNMTTGERLNSNFGRIRCIVQNTGDKTLVGLQLRGVAIDYSEAVIKEKLITPIPLRRDALAPNETLDIDLYIEPIPDLNALTQMNIQVVGLKIKQ